jgi:hypothetical protein
MASRRGATPPPIEVKQFTADEIDRGIAKLRRRIDEVGGLEPGGIRYDDARVGTAETNIRETVRDVFGSASPEFHDHHITTFGTVGTTRSMVSTGANKNSCRGSLIQKQCLKA